ncbi:hypothetical protein DMENIID0001_099590 [Sergentomyia squamirostris]
MKILPQKFCFFFDLRMGIVWLAWFMMLLNIPIMVLMFLVIANRNTIFEEHPNLESSLIPLCILETGAAFIQIFTNIFLINGVVKKSHLDMVPWLVINKVTIALFFITTIIIGLDLGDQLPVVIYVLLGFIAIVLTYFWLCVFSLFKMCKSWNNGDNPPLTDLESMINADDISDDEILQ